MLNSSRWLSFALICAALTSCTDQGPQRSGPEVLWSAPGHIWSRPIISHSYVIAGHINGDVIAYNRTNGSIAWQRDLRGPFYGRHLIHHGDQIIVPEYELHALDASTGQVNWTYGGVIGTAGVNTPGISGDTLYVADAGSGVAVALDANTGQEIWTNNIGEALFTPAVSDDLVVYGTRSYLGGPLIGPYGEGHVIALDRATGVERWRHFIPDDPTLHGSGGAVNGGRIMGDKVIVGARNGRVYALRLSDGELLWEHYNGADPATGYYPGHGVPVGDYLVLARADGIVEARRSSDGIIMWSTRFADGYVFPYPDTCGQFICMASGRIWILDINGNIVWSHGGGDTRFVYLTPPAVDTEGRIYVGGVRRNSDMLFALRIPVQVGPTP